MEGAVVLKKKTEEAVAEENDDLLGGFGPGHSGTEYSPQFLHTGDDSLLQEGRAEWMLTIEGASVYASTRT